MSFSAGGVPCLLLKGRAFAVLLYRDGSPRPYSDCDLLVPQSAHERAGTILTGLGFAVTYGAEHSIAWHRPSDDLWVDLHHTLPLVNAAPERVWTTLSARATSLTVGGEATRVLDPAASALLAALHLVHHGPETERPREDLERAVALLGMECWHEAAALARELDAEAPLGTGLRLVPSGVRIADRLGLAWAPSAQTLLDWDNAPWGAGVWEALANAPGTRARVSLIWEFLAPPPEFMRARSPLARRGRRGLLAAYVVRPFKLADKAARSFGAWRRARREASRPRSRRGSTHGT